MNNKICYILFGIPGSGKTTERNRIIEESKGKTKYVNLDELRKVYPELKEKQIVDIAISNLNEIMDMKLDVVIDNTNLVETKIISAAKRHKNSQMYKFRYIPMMDSFYVDKCHKRNMNREDPDARVPVRTIEEMALKFYKRYDELNGIKEKNIEPIKEDAAIFDIDGTLATMGKRSPFEWHKVGCDTPNNDIFEQLEFYHATGHKIIILSGRDGCCLDETKKWLHKNLDRYGISIEECEFIMRKEKDSRPDALVKWEIYNEKIRPYFNVKAVFDDRLSVCRMWRGIGLRCFQVDAGLF